MRDLAIDSTNLYIRDRVQTFIDNVIIESVQDITRRPHSPTRYGDEPLIKQDKPWEHLIYFTYPNYTVLRDPQDGLFKAWYEDMEQIPGRFTKSHVHHHSRQHYAESEDGISWTKPELENAIIDGNKTNIVLGSEEYGEAHSANYIIDPHPSTPEERFRVLFSHWWEDDAGSYTRIECAHSPDGKSWTLYDEYPRFGLSGPQLNDVSVLFYDEDSREFVQNTRHFLQWAGDINLRTPLSPSFLGTMQPHNALVYNQRRVWQSRSHDFIHWSELVPVAATDEEDNLDESYYGMKQFRLGSIYLATVGVFRGVDNEMEVQLLVSRDGIRWSNTNKRRPFLSPRGEGHWDAHMVSLTSAPIEVGDELYFYHGGTNSHHDWWLCDSETFPELPENDKPGNVKFGLGLAKLRKDGYAGLYANKMRLGTIVTRALISLGTELTINAKCAPGGSLKVEIVNRKDDVVGQCSRENCDVFTGDGVAHKVTWNGNPTIPAGREGDVYWRKVRFFLDDAELFSFQFVGKEMDDRVSKQGTAGK